MISNLFEEVLQLQIVHSPNNTPEMARRGELIRKEIPEIIREWPESQQGAAFPFKGRLNVQGRDGTGLKTFVPWVRVHSPELSPSAQNGWYVVYLFHQDGKGVSLCLSHGSTRFDGGDYRPRSIEETKGLMKWANGLLEGQFEPLGFRTGVVLNSKEKLSKAYEKTTVCSKTYSATAIPNDDVLQKDLNKAVSLLGELYRSAELGRSPESEEPEIAQASDAVSAISRPQVAKVGGRGQGFKLSTEERAAVEARAMDAARTWLDDNGYEKIRDVSAKESCDFWAEKAGVAKFVEVKGTTGRGESILLTANEVELHRTLFPDTLLILVYEIELIESRTKAVGGRLRVIEEWDIENAELKPLSYVCNLSLEVDGKSK